MLKIRLMRQGRKKIYRYRIVVCDVRVAPKGKYIKLLGYYNPQKTGFEYTLKKEAILEWLKIGALPTTTVKNILKKEKIWENFMSQKKPKKLNKKNRNSKNKITDKNYKARKKRQELRKKALAFSIKKQAEKEENEKNK